VVAPDPVFGQESDLTPNDLSVQGSVPLARWHGRS